MEEAYWVAISLSSGDFDPSQSSLTLSYTHGSLEGQVIPEHCVVPSRPTS